MLQAIMDQKLFLYGMIVAGIIGVWCLFWSNRFYHIATKDMKRRENPKGKWTSQVMEAISRREVPVSNAEAFIRARLQESRVLNMRIGSLLNGVNLAVTLCGAFLLLGIWSVYLFQYERYVLYQYLLLSGSVISVLLLLRLCLNADSRQQRLVDGWTDYLENPGTAKAENETVNVVTLEQKRKTRGEKRSEQETAITQVEQKIREKAGPKSKFAGLLNPEDEKLMREVIREYLT